DHDGDTVPGSLTINVDDDTPTVSANAAVQLDDDALGGNADGTGDVNPDTANLTGTLLHSYGADGAGSTLLSGAGLPTSSAVNGDFIQALNANGTVLTISQIQNGVAVAVVSVSLSDTTAGAYTVAQLHAIDHPAGANENDVAFTVGYTTTDHDGDTAPGSLTINVDDDTPTITKPFDGDRNNLTGDPLIGTHEILANVNPSSAVGDFGYSIGADSHSAAFYGAGGSDFVDQDGDPLNGIQLSLFGNLTGLVPNTETPFISSYATLQPGEDAHQATFNWQITYDSDPNSAVDPPATAGGTLVFNKDADTYTITLNDALEGFTKDILHTSELLSKEPTSNVGHPNIVVEKLFDATKTSDPNDEDFFVQFTANSTTNTIKFGLNTTGDSDDATPSDTAWNIGDLVTNNHEDWVSATQSTNGVAGDTIQKGELLTLRFFDHSPTIASEIITPNQTANDMAIKFDGIGNSEDLMVILDLVGADGVGHTTKAIYISNADIFKTGQVPDAYAADFPLDNNDGLVIIERNDYNGANENWVIQGAQIMQSGNGITGNTTAIDLQRATGSDGGSTTFALQNWDATDNDVLKIVDLGFTSTQTTTPQAHLDFGVQLQDADGDTTTIQHILVDVI
ncbi:hypothetical protein NKH19_31645, partial [Mesorhizobium sp. M1338]